MNNVNAIDAVMDVADTIAQEIELLINNASKEENELLGAVGSTEGLGILIINAVQAKLASRYADVEAVSLPELAANPDAFIAFCAMYGDYDE